jgi:hypothetical protein
MQQSLTYVYISPLEYDTSFPANLTRTWKDCIVMIQMMKKSFENHIYIYIYIYQKVFLTQAEGEYVMSKEKRKKISGVIFTNKMSAVLRTTNLPN